jgi:hypothetical protein
MCFDILLFMMIVCILAFVCIKYLGIHTLFKEIWGGSEFEDRVRAIFRKVIKPYPNEDNNDFNEIKSGEFLLKENTKPSNRHSKYGLNFLSYRSDNKQIFIDYDGFLLGNKTYEFPSIAFEAQGPHHYGPTNQRNKPIKKPSEDQINDYIKVRCKDILKMKLSKENSVILFRIPYHWNTSPEILKYNIIDMIGSTNSTLLTDAAKIWYFDNQNKGLKYNKPITYYKLYGEKNPCARYSEPAVVSINTSSKMLR